MKEREYVYFSLNGIKAGVEWDQNSQRYTVFVRLEFGHPNWLTPYLSLSNEKKIVKKAGSFFIFNVL